MTLAVTFFLRVFLYGLVAFVPSGDDAFVLLGRAQGHTPFIVVEECVGSCPEFEDSEGTLFPGVLLEGYDIEIAPFTQDDSGPSPLMRTAVMGDELPADSADARSLAWVPEMRRFLEDPQDAQVHACYLLRNPTSECSADRALLAGRMHVRSGAFKTCQLVQRRAGQPIYSFEFKGHIFGPDRREQALAEIVDLTLSQTITADFVTLMLRDFEGQTKYEIKLMPSSCPEGPEDAKCVDIFIGNIPPRNPDDPHRVGRHFVHLYDLLLEEPTKFLPHRNFLRSTGPAVQPVCRPVPSPEFSAQATASVQHHGAKIALARAVVLTAPESRSVCPMVVLDPP